MSYPQYGGPGYPPGGPSPAYPPGAPSYGGFAASGYPPAGPGAGVPGYPQSTAAPYPPGGGAGSAYPPTGGYPSSGPGFPSSTPYPPQPGGGPSPAYAPGAPSYGGFAASGYPPAGPGTGVPGYPQSTAAPYPPGGGAGSAYPPTGGYPPSGPGYPSSSTYPTQPPASGYPSQQPFGGYPSQQPFGGYPSQQPPGGYPSQQPPGGYPSQQPPGGYPSQQPSGGYPSQQGFPAQPSYPANPSQPGAYPGGQHPATTSGGPGFGGASALPGGYNQSAAYSTQSVPQNQTYMQAPKDRGTVKPYSPFNGQADAEVIRKAMKGFGTDEKAIIDVLAHRNNAQRQKITLDFKTMYGKDLIKELKSELSGKFEDVILALLMKPSDYDAMCIYNAIQGLGTDEGALIEILCTRSNKQMLEIKQAYKTMFRKDIERDITGDTSGHFGRLLVSMATGNRDESTTVDIARAQADARALYEAGEKKWGTDESRFNAILAAQSFPQVQRVCDEYQKLTGHAMEKAISGEMSGDLKQGMMTIVKCVRNRSAYFAERLYTSMKGLGTNDRQLVRVVVTRCEVDMVQIKQEFQRNYGKTLESFINDDTSGDYKRVLVALVAGN